MQIYKKKSYHDNRFFPRLLFYVFLRPSLLLLLCCKVTKCVSLNMSNIEFCLGDFHSFFLSYLLFFFTRCLHQIHLLCTLISTKNCVFE